MGEAATQSQAAEESDTGVVTAQSRDAVETGVQQALEAWTLAMRSNDPERISECYADRVERYFLQENWDREAIRNYMTRWFQGGTKRIDGFSVSTLAFKSESDTLSVVGITKDLIINDSTGRHEHLIRSELHMEKTGHGRWLITSERDFN